MMEVSEVVNTVYPTVGSMAMPVNFKYKDALRRGRPIHGKWDEFWMKHPPMPASRWAKIFSPFDALAGFDEAIKSKEELYVQRIELDEDERKNLNRTISELHNLTWNSRMARVNHVVVSVTFFVPCADRNNNAFYLGEGKYETMTGVVLCAEGNALLLRTTSGKHSISFDDIREIRIHRNEGQS